MISDNNHIIYTAEDIQRYWNGQLTPGEMHAMEKAALDDPFLADAMEGMGMAMKEHDTGMLNTRLEESREYVQARAAGTVQTAPVRSFRWWQVAAAAFVLLVAGYWIFSSGRSEADGTLAKQESTNENANTADAAKENATAGKGPAYKADSNLTPPVSADTAVIGFQATADEPGLREFKTSQPSKKKKDVFFLAPENKDIAASKSLPPAFPETRKQKQFEPPATRDVAANANPDTARKMETEVIKVQETFAESKKADDLLAAKEPKLQNIVSGIVTDNKNNPLPNVFLRLDNNKNSYTTDPLGNFKIPVTDSVVNVSASLQGYATQNFQLRSTHNGTGSVADNQIRLQSDAELAANQSYYSRAIDKKDKARFDKEFIAQRITQQDAQPVYGWLTFEQYIAENKRRPASNPLLTGEVILSFEINRQGERSNYRIDKSLSADHDAEAIRLVKEGPAWKLNKGRKSRATVIVRF